MRDRIGEARAVHVQAEPARAGELADRGDFVGRIDQAIFGRVGDRDRVRLDLVDVVGGSRRSPRGSLSGVSFAPSPSAEHQLGAMRVEFGRAAFVVLDMRVAVADDAAVRRAQRGEREAVGGGARRHPQRAHLGPEQRRRSRASSCWLSASPS